jgi:hypothetical protein
MPLPIPVQDGDMPHTIYSAAAIATVLYLPVMRPGRVKDFHVTVNAALGTANQTFQLAYAQPTTGTPSFVDVTGALVTQLTSGSAAGMNVRTQVGVSTSAYVQDGGTFRITPAGGGSAGTPVVATVVVGN